MTEDRYRVELTERGFVVYDAQTDEVLRGAFSQRFRAREVAAEMNAHERAGWRN